MSSGQCHWTRWIADMCPRLDTCSYLDGSSGLATGQKLNPYKRKQLIYDSHKIFLKMND